VIAIRRSHNQRIAARVYRMAAAPMSGKPDCALNSPVETGFVSRIDQKERD
jgi:hypothetical protein